MRAVGSRIKELEAATRDTGDELNALLLDMPNLPAADVPDGLDDEANVVERVVGEIPSFDFEPPPALGHRRAVGSHRPPARRQALRIALLCPEGKGRQTAAGLDPWMLDLHTAEHGYTELYLPYLVSRETAETSGQLPKFDDTCTAMMMTTYG